MQEIPMKSAVQARADGGLLTPATQDREMDKVGTVFWKCINRTWGVIERTHKITLDLWWGGGVPTATSPSLLFLVFICNSAPSVTDMVCTVSGIWQKRWRVTPEEGCKRCVSYWLPPGSFPVEKASQGKVFSADHWGPYQQLHLRTEVLANSMRLFSVEATSSSYSTLDQLQPRMGGLKLLWALPAKTVLSGH